MVDKTGLWSGGGAVPVKTGDLVDRGERVRGALDLFIRPQDEAAMAEWLAAHPPGWVEYAMAMRPEGRYGRRLRTLPAAFELDGQLFVHAGFSPEMRGLEVAEVNRRAADEIATFGASRARMAADGFGLPFSSARELVDVIAKEIAYLNGLDGARQRRAKGRIEAANVLQPLTGMGGWSVLAETGPLFFKGATAWDDDDRGAEMAAILDGAGATRMVVGHASGPDKHIHARFGGRVVIASTELSDDPWGTNRPAALEIVDGQTFVVTPSSRAPLPDGV